MILVVLGKEIVEDLYVPVIGEAEIANPACLTFFEQEVEHSVVDIAIVQFLHAVLSAAHGMEQHIVDIVNLQFAK